ncbi:MAG: PHP domain-containing protein [Firmicutes bacterium]|nr:PHP domain-containing protein [Bacillota bacterium]
MQYADLHLHSTASDGTSSPEEVVRRAGELGFSVISLTDHDSVGGLEQAISMGEKLNVEVIPGIELSTLHMNEEVHILGYYINWKNGRLKNKLEYFIRARKSRADKMIEKLNSMGINITRERVLELAGSNFVGRPHIARAMLEKGYIKDLSEAFTADFIGKGGRAYVERHKISPFKAIELILSVKGIPVLAHPGVFKRDEWIKEELIRELVDGGLMGIEVFYPQHSAELTEYYLKVAKKYRLLVSGGSDYHGENSGRNILGSVKLPIEYVYELKDRVTQLKIQGY